MNKDLGKIKHFPYAKELIVSIKDAMIKLEKTGTADIVVGKNYGISIKDEGNFVTKEEAFNFAKQIQDYLRKPKLTSS